MKGSSPWLRTPYPHKAELAGCVEANEVEERRALIRLGEMVVVSCLLNVDGSRIAVVMSVIDFDVNCLEYLLLKA